MSLIRRPIKHGTACKIADLYDRMQKMVAAKNKEAFARMMVAGQCYIMTGGQKVTIVDSKGFLLGMFQFADKKGDLWWTEPRHLEE